MPTRSQPDNAKTLAAVIAPKAEIDSLLARLVALSADHFGLEPDSLNWGDVSTLELYRARAEGNHRHGLQGGLIRGLTEQDAGFRAED